jgi:translocation and assembly module TamA
LDGLESVEEAYLRRVIEWPEGELYDRRVLAETRRRMVDTKLFESVALRPAEQLADDGSLPVTLETSEAKHRTVSLGGGFSTDEGFDVRASWEHRNLLGEQERLRFVIDASQLRQFAEVGLRKPHFRRREHTLLLLGEFVREDSDAFEELSASGSLGLERKWGEFWTVAVAGSGEYSRIDDLTGDNNYTLIGAHFRARHDNRDDILNPTEGVHASFTTSPYVNLIGESSNFWVNEVHASSYYPLDAKDAYILAGRLRLGSIVGEETPSIPANKRFYSGGGGSVRGYAFRTVGPLDPSNDPTGGRSVIELNVELRARITEDIGIVPFLDGGQVYFESWPEPSEELLWAGGLGLRYFTGIGPLRLDVAAPINGRDVDDPFQFYISFGQAF